MTARTAAISFGLVNGRPVFADLEDDSYFMLEPDEERAFMAQLEAEPRNDPTSPSPASRDFVEPVDCRIAEASIIDQVELQERPSIGDVIATWRLLARARRAIRTKPIAEILGQYEAGALPGNAGPGMTAPANRFAIARRFIPIRRNCLTDSLALLSWLSRHGERAELVLGVKLDPFAAHCWVQAEGILLNDHLEQIERFTPVRMIQCPIALP